MKKLLCATVFTASCSVFGAGASAPNAISFEGYTSATTLQLVNGVNEYDARNHSPISSLRAPRIPRL